MPRCGGTRFNFSTGVGGGGGLRQVDLYEVTSRPAWFYIVNTAKAVPRPPPKETNRPEAGQVW